MLKLGGERERVRTVIVALLVTATAAVFAFTADGGRDSTVEILNDTNHPVLLWQCKQEDCKHDFAGKGLMKPGHHIRAGVSTVGVPNPWLVLAPNTQRRLGCLPIVFPNPRAGVVARLSLLVPCRASYDHSIAWPPD
jgi:hypothetical protein